ncbi:MAG: hypothetical protein QG639_190, partial [Patescibacteria group bacterium]|nr:hypothetical protein [Patescibacteria group bacterium]
MDTNLIVTYLIEFSFILSTFFISLTWAILIGRQSVINLILGIYLAIALFLFFPYLDSITAKIASEFSDLPSVLIFITFTVGGFFLAKRISPAEYRENKLESFPKKILLATALTILVLIVSFSILPASFILSTPIEVLDLFTRPALTFWWLL